MTLEGHHIEDEDGLCHACWGSYADRCSECDGWLHGEFGDYISLDSYYLEYCCEKCGSTAEPEDDY